MKKVLAVVMLALATAQVSAAGMYPANEAIKVDSVTGLKHYKFWDNWFVAAHIGGNFQLGENVRFNDIHRVLGLSTGLSFGKWFSPALGVRVQGLFQTLRGRANEEAIEAYPKEYGHGIYHYRTANAYLDVLFNLNNILGTYKESTRWNVIALMGAGFNSTFGFESDVIDRWNKLEEGWYTVDDRGKTYFAAHAGLMVTYKINDALDLGLEATVNATDDKFNGIRYDDKYDGYLNALLGLTYHFKDHYGDRRFKYTSVDDRALVEDLNSKINDARQELANAKPQQVIKEETKYNEVLDVTVSFIIDKYNITDIQKKNVAFAAKYLEEHPDCNLVITGYADVQTAYPAYNLKLSQRRANAVYNMLVKDFKVSPDRIRVDYKGDTVQPYSKKNEWNRVVVFITEPRNK